jgi:hypothetical protein
MAIAALLAIAATTANSSDITLAADAEGQLLLVSASDPDNPADADVLVQRKAASGDYFTFTRLTSFQPLLSITGPFVGRVRRIAGASVGVDQDGFTV